MSELAAQEWEPEEFRSAGARGARPLGFGRLCPCVEGALNSCGTIRRYFESPSREIPVLRKPGHLKAAVLHRTPN